MSKKLTYNQKQILDYLNSQENQTARLKDMRENLPIYAGAAYFSQGIKSMMNRVLIEKVERGVYRAVITSEEMDYTPPKNLKTVKI